MSITIEKIRKAVDELIEELNKEPLKVFKEFKRIKNMEKESLEDRQRRYEKNERLVTGVPVRIRVDGKAFHTLTKKIKAEKPFDQDIIDSMVYAAKSVAENLEGFKIAYIQSDEATFIITDYDTIKTGAYFNYRLDKLVSIPASIMSVSFSKRISSLKLQDIDAYFAAKADNIPEWDISNQLLWRAKDWERNSLSMFCRSFFSYKQLLSKNRNEQHEMLHSVGKNWATDITDQQRNGTFLIKKDDSLLELYDILPDYAFINYIVQPLFSNMLREE